MIRSPLGFLQTKKSQFPQEQLSYEERECEGGQFAVVEVTGKPFDEASKEAALKLLKYVGGSNDKGEMLAGQL